MKKIIVLIIIILMLMSIDVFAGSNRIMLNYNGMVILLNWNNQLIKSYPGTWNPNNVKVYTNGDKFWVLQNNGWVSVYEVENGRFIKSYYATQDQTKSGIRNNNTRSWIR